MGVGDCLRAIPAACFGKDAIDVCLDRRLTYEEIAPDFSIGPSGGAPGDRVNVLFNVPPLPAGCSTVQLSVASYTRTSSQHHADLFSSDSGTFLPGGRYEMQVTSAPSSTPALEHVVVVFASGSVRPRPHYGNTRIDRGRG